MNSVRRIRHLIPRVQSAVLALLIAEENEKVLAVALGQLGQNVLLLIVVHRAGEHAILQRVDNNVAIRFWIRLREQLQR